MSFATIRLVDANGIIVPDAGSLVKFKVTGSGILAGVDNGDPVSHSSSKKSNGKPGKIQLEVTSEGLPPVTVEVVVNSDALTSENRCII